MIIDTFVKLLPIIIITGGGYIVARGFDLSINSLVTVITDFFMPMLIFHALYTSTISGAEIFGIAGVTTLVVVIPLTASLLYAKAVRIDTREYIPSMIFMNSGFLGIPLMKLWGGIAAMNLVVVYDQIQTIYIFTLGLFIITGGFSRRGLNEILHAPILWAIGAGFLFRFLHVPLPDPFLTTFEFGGNAAPPLAAFTLGASLRNTKLHFDRHLAAGLFIRFVIGFLAGYFSCILFNITGLTRTVLIVASTLPSAVFTSVLPLRYGVRSDFASTLVIISTLLGIFTIPLSFWLAVNL